MKKVKKGDIINNEDKQCWKVQVRERYLSISILWLLLHDSVGFSYCSIWQLWILGLLPHCSTATFGTCTLNFILSKVSEVVLVLVKYFSGDTLTLLEFYHLWAAENKDEERRSTGELEEDEETVDWKTMRRRSRSRMRMKQEVVRRVTSRVYALREFTRIHQLRNRFQSSNLLQHEQDFLLSYWCKAVNDISPAPAAAYWQTHVSLLEAEDCTGPRESRPELNPLVLSGLI